MPTFETVSFDNLWSNAVTKFRQLKSEHSVIGRRYAAKSRKHYCEIMFENGDSVILPVDLAEVSGPIAGE